MRKIIFVSFLTATIPAYASSNPSFNYQSNVLIENSKLAQLDLGEYQETNVNLFDPVGNFDPTGSPAKIPVDLGLSPEWAVGSDNLERERQGYKQHEVYSLKKSHRQGIDEEFSRFAEKFKAKIK